MINKACRIDPSFLLLFTFRWRRGLRVSSPVPDIHSGAKEQADTPELLLLLLGPGILDSDKLDTLEDMGYVVYVRRIASRRARHCHPVSCDLHDMEQLRGEYILRKLALELNLVTVTSERVEFRRQPCVH
ncbi:hypothetical protein MTO96_005034 [Rhipicephalus appendiculatus]